MAAKKKSYKRLGATRKYNEINAGILSKLISDPRMARSYEDKTDRQQTSGIGVTKGLVEGISKETAQSSYDADTTMQLLPDLGMAQKILVSSILSPNDMVQTDLLYTFENRGDYPPGFMASFLEIIKNHFESEYKIEDQMETMLTEMLFTKGAHIVMVMPETIVDYMINGSAEVSVENYQEFIDLANQPNKSMGILGLGNQGKDTRVKDIFDTSGLKVSDNYMILRQQQYRRMSASARVKKSMSNLSVSTEAVSGLTPAQIKAYYETKRNRDSQPTSVVPNADYLDREQQGNPLVMKLPIESTIPVYVPGDPQKHVGYFVLLDERGSPISMTDKGDVYEGLKKRFNSANQSSGSDRSSEIINKVREEFGGKTDSTSEKMRLDQFQQAYTSIIETELLNRLENGAYQEEFKLGGNEEIYRIMLARAFESKGTNLLYIPAEYLVYMAFNYNEYGIGESLLERSKVISSIRTVLMFANTLSAIRSSVGRRRVSISIDENDPDPAGSIENIKNLVVESGLRNIPIGSTDPAGSMEYLARSAYEFAIEVDGPRYPKTKVEYDDLQRDVPRTDDELQRTLFRQQISSMGLNPELVDPLSSPDFAVSVVTNNLMLTRQILQYQKRFSGYLTRFIQLYVACSPKLRSQVEEWLSNNKSTYISEFKKLGIEIGDTFYEQLVRQIKVQLPSPDTSKLDQQGEQLSKYVQVLDQALEAYPLDQLFMDGEIGEDQTEMLDKISIMVKSYFIRRYIEQNNILPELSEMLELDENKPGFDLIGIQGSMKSSIGKAIGNYIKKVKKDIKSIQDKALKEQESEAPIEDDALEDTETEDTLDEEPDDDGDFDDEELSDLDEEDET